MSGKYLVTDLLISINELHSKDTIFALAAAVDSVLAFEALVKAHNNAKKENIQLACHLFSAAVFKSRTNTVASISYLDGEK